MRQVTWSTAALTTTSLSFLPTEPDLDRLQGLFLVREILLKRTEEARATTLTRSNK